MIFAPPHYPSRVKGYSQLLLCEAPKCVVCNRMCLRNEKQIFCTFLFRFLSKMSVLRGKLQLVGATALFLAAKYEEIYPPGVKDFIYLTDDCYTVDQVCMNERTNDGTTE